MAHEWGNNIIIIQGNGIIKTIATTKHLGTNMRRPKVLQCFDYQNDITYEEDLMFVSEHELFSRLEQLVYLWIL
jgi:hypothetical protein